MHIDGLKRCPFCGEDVAEFVVFPPEEPMRFSTRYGIVCDYGRGGCGGASGIYKTPQEAIEAWNQRRRKPKHERA